MPPKKNPTLITCLYTFQLPLRPNQINDFRGAFIDMAASSGKLKDEDITLLANREYKNKDWGKEKEQYPFIHYRVEDGKAAIFALGDGVDVLDKIIHHKLLGHFTMRNEVKPLQVVTAYKQERTIKSGTKEETYLLFHYLPYDKNSDHDYHAADTMKDKIDVLEKTMTKAITTSIQDIGQLKHNVKIAILDIITKDLATYKTVDKEGKENPVKLVSYFIKLRCNIHNLDQIAIGKHKSLGYGVLRKSL